MKIIPSRVCDMLFQDMEECEMTDSVKNYFKTIFSECSKIELVWWWILRGLMIFEIVYVIGKGSNYSGSDMIAQAFANFVGMFAYEITRLFPKKSRMRLLSPRFQNVSALGFFLGSFCGAFLSFYYKVPGYDKILHAFGTAEAVYIGYEYVAAIQLKYKKTCPHQIATLCSLGIAFILSSAWEVFEFLYDQFFGGDVQHWSYANALASAGGNPDAVFNLFPVSDPMRFALMDTMGDIVLNFVGGLIMYAVLCIFPYRHKGKGDVNAKILRELAEERKSEYEAATV